MAPLARLSPYWYQVVAIIIGVAVLGMPGAVSALGWVLGIIVIASFSGLNLFAGIALTNVFVAATAVLGRRPCCYSDLGLAASGAKGEKAVRYAQYTQLWMLCVVGSAPRRLASAASLLRDPADQLIPQATSAS